MRAGTPIYNFDFYIELIFKTKIRIIEQIKKNYKDLIPFIFTILYH